MKGTISEVISELGNRHPQTGTALSGVSCPAKPPDPAHAHGLLFSVWGWYCPSPRPWGQSSPLHPSSLPPEQREPPASSKDAACFLCLFLSESHQLMSGWTLFPFLPGFLNYSRRKQRLHGLFSKSFVILSLCVYFQTVPCRVVLSVGRR